MVIFDMALMAATHSGYWHCNKAMSWERVYMISVNQA